jgi:hypothetical protein
VGCFPTRLLGPRRRSRCRFGGTNPIRLELLAASRVGPAAAHPRGGPASCLVCSITVSPLDPGCRSAERPEDETRTWLGEQYGVLTGRTKYFHDSHAMPDGADLKEFLRTTRKILRSRCMGLTSTSARLCDQRVKEISSPQVSNSLR